MLLYGLGRVFGTCGRESAHPRPEIPRHRLVEFPDNEYDHAPHVVAGLCILARAQLPQAPLKVVPDLPVVSGRCPATGNNHYVATASDLGKE